MESLRRTLTGYAYSITGSYEEAKDIVQDVFLHFSQTDTALIKDIKSYLIRSVINLSINRKKKMSRMVASYSGHWLPEPVATEKADAALHRSEILSYSLMVLLEKLNAQQRAVFILKEAFDYEHTEIAEVLGITTEYSRKILSRAKKQLETNTTQPLAATNDHFSRRYLEAIQHRDTQLLEQLLKEDIAILSDGGGKATAALNTLHGQKRAIAFLQGIFRKFHHKYSFQQTIINHQPALLYYEGNQLVNCQIFTLENDAVSNIYFIRNPDKLKTLEQTFTR